MQRRTPIRGARVELCRPAPSDRRAFVEATRRSRSLHRPWVHPPTTPSGFDSWMCEGEDGRRERWLVWRTADRALVGYVAANEVVFGAFQSAYLGYWATEGCQGQGLMSEAVGVVLDHLFTRRSFRLHRLEANIQPENARSRALAEGLGFRLEGLSRRYLKVAGRWRDHERWAITAEDWRASRRRAG
ncbi:MAG: GNAT family N-acetyltransferase [Myxococcota bacterium]